jgi:hypothetical protein
LHVSNYFADVRHYYHIMGDSMQEVQQVQLDSKEHGHKVPVTIDNRTVEIQAREWVVSQLKTALGVDFSRELEQVVDGKLVPLDDNAKVHIRGHEVFVSHVRGGGSSHGDRD